MNQSFIIALRDLEIFRAAMREVLEQRPVVPAYKPCRTSEDEQMLLAEIRYQSGAQQGFDMLWITLTGNKPYGEQRNARKRADSEPGA